MKKRRLKKIQEYGFLYAGMVSIRLWRMGIEVKGREGGVTKNI